MLNYSIFHARYEDKDPLGMNLKKVCQHKSEKTKFRCASLSTDVILKNRRKFYGNKNKIDQDMFLCRLLSTYEPVRRDKVTPKNLKNRQVSCTYNLFNRNNKVVPVCKKQFIASFSVNEKRLRNLNKTLVKGQLPREKRGGDHRSHKSIEKKESLRRFLNNLPAQESHYSRQKSKRIYLHSELYAKKLLKLYNDSVPVNLKINPSMFYTIFHGEFNIGFRKPSSDACNICTLLTNKINNESNSKIKTEYMVQKRIHKIRSNAFYDLLKKDVPGSITLCFDLQQVLPLPKTPIQDSFYSRQISLYNFCIYNVDAKKSFFFVWDETQANRGATEVGSALYCYLNNLSIPRNMTLIRLFCDGCGGQNKNSFIIHVLMQWLFSKSPKNLNEIQLNYPVRGHSFLPADRVFGRIEKDLRRCAVITKKEDYIAKISRHGDVHTLGQHWRLKDIKELSVNFKKIERIQNLKRVFIQKMVNRRTGKVLNCKVIGHELYRFETGSEEAVSLLKRGKRIPLEISTLDHVLIPLSGNKKKDVDNLLKKQFGDAWRNTDYLTWYKHILDDVQDGLQEEEHYQDTACECNEPDDLENLRI